MPNKFSRVFVTGGAGYVGSVLIPQLLERGYTVTSYDISYYGDNFLPQSNPNLKVIHGDIRDTAKLAKAIAGHDAFISLACISNDASFELDENLSTSVNLDAFEPMVLAAKEAGVKRFIYRLVELGLRRLRSAERDRGASAGPAHALQQVQGHVRAAAVQAHGRRASSA